MSDQNQPGDVSRRFAVADGDDPGPTLDPRIQELIGRSLQAHFDDLSQAPVPDKFLALLAQLEAKEKGAK